jgi:hypothetical protein
MNSKYAYSSDKTKINYKYNHYQKFPGIFVKQH